MNWPAGRLAVLESALLALDGAEAAHDLIQAEGSVVFTASTGAAHINPRVRVERDARAAFARLFDQLGLTR